jgi:hypothetical protein
MGARWYSSTILNLGTRWRRVVRFTLLPLYPRYSLYRRLDGRQTRAGRCELKKNLLHQPGIEPITPRDTD